MQGLWGNEAAKHHRICGHECAGLFRHVADCLHRSGALCRRRERCRALLVGSVATTRRKRCPSRSSQTIHNIAFHVWDELTIDPEQLKAWQEDRRGCVVDKRLAERYGWQIGEQIPLQGTFFPFALDLTLRGTFQGPQNTDMLWFDWNYLDEMVRAKATRATGNSGTIWAKTTNADMAVVSKAIDDKFASSENPTRTQTEAAFAQMFTDMLGDIQAVIQWIGLAVVFSSRWSPVSHGHGHARTHHGDRCAESHRLFQAPRAGHDRGRSRNDSVDRWRNWSCHGLWFARRLAPSVCATDSNFDR